MNIVRLLLLLAAAWLVWRLLRGMLGQASRNAPPKIPENFEPMARCARCGVHMPAASLSSAGLCGRCATA